MGAGKSTVGTLLAARIGWDFLDLDTHIQVTTGKSANELFASLGEVEFRQLESRVLADALQRSKAILAPGGAVIDKEENQSALAKSTGSFIVFLDAPFETLIDRCMLQEQTGNATYRPLLHQTSIARTRYEARRLLYASHARLTVDVAEKSPEETLEFIWKAMFGSVRQVW